MYWRGYSLAPVICKHDITISVLIVRHNRKTNRRIYAYIYIYIYILIVVIDLHMVYTFFFFFNVHNNNLKTNCLTAALVNAIYLSLSYTPNLQTRRATNTNGNYTLTVFLLRENSKIFRQ